MTTEAAEPSHARPGNSSETAADESSPAEAEPMERADVIEVQLRPINEAARSQAYAWQIQIESNELASAASAASAPGTPPTAGEGQLQQALSLDADVDPTWLDAGESWRTARYRCHAFAFGSSAAGPVKSCIDLGAEGKAGSLCEYTVDPRTVAKLVHPGPNLNPLDEHYFRGRVTGFLTGGQLLAAGLACL